MKHIKQVLFNSLIKWLKTLYNIDGCLYFIKKSSYGYDTDLITMHIYKCFQLSSAEKGFMSMTKQKVQQLENHINAKQAKKEKKIRIK